MFDILHRGHVTYLAQARALGASLVVAVNSDASVRSLGKGDDRPLNAGHDRAALVAALECVTLVTIFDESVPLVPLETVRPDIYVPLLPDHRRARWALVRTFKTFQRRPGLIAGHVARFR